MPRPVLANLLNDELRMYEHSLRDLLQEGCRDQIQLLGLRVILLPCPAALDEFDCLPSFELLGLLAYLF